MECIKASTMRHSGSMEWECALPYTAPPGRLWARSRRVAFINPHASWDSYSRNCKCTSIVYPVRHLQWGHLSWRACAASVSLDEEFSSPLDDDGESEELTPERLGSDELKSLLADSERAKLIRKLSDANQYNRFLKRQLQSRDAALENFKAELAVLEIELQTLVGLAEEVAKYNMPVGSRRINGKYIQSHLLSRLEAVHEKVKEKIKDVNSLKFEDITVFWVGMAESVQVMGSFDGWSKGEEMSPEYSGDYARFSATLKLRPGRYEIKFLVDGEWRLSPEFPTVGEGMMKNNLLIVAGSS